jgi:muramoyltetrapeptide carboxypeptidase
MRPLAPPTLSPGDRVGVIAPAGPPRRRALEAGIAVLERRGFEVMRGRHLHDRLGYLAGTDAHRLADLNAMLRDRRLAAIWFARGGYGLHRIIGGADIAALGRAPKALVGYSDITVLQAAAWRRLGLGSYQGPMVTELGDPRAYRAGPLWRCLAGETLEVPFGRRSVVRPGRASGPLVGGCLSLLVALVGTPYEPPLEGAILFWEEVNEEPFRIDRMLAHLRLAGRLDRLAGMVVGNLTGCRARRRGNGLPIASILATHLAGTDYPVVTGIPAGHGPGKITLPMGFPARIDTRAGLLTVR